MYLYFYCSLISCSQATPFHQQRKEIRLVREWQEKLIQGLMMKSCVKALAVPSITYDMVVQTCLLRKLGEPVTLFREKEIERHERLTTIMAKLDADESSS